MHNSKLRCTHRMVCNLAGQELKSILSDQRKNDVMSSLENNHFVFRLPYLADIFLQLNQVNLKLQRRGRTIVNFIDTLSSFVEKLENWNRKVHAKNFAMFRESCHGGWI